MRQRCRGSRMIGLPHVHKNTLPQAPLLRPVFDVRQGYMKRAQIAVPHRNSSSHDRGVIWNPSHTQFPSDTVQITFMSLSVVAVVEYSRTKWVLHTHRD